MRLYTVAVVGAWLGREQEDRHVVERRRRGGTRRSASRVERPRCPRRGAWSSGTNRNGTPHDTTWTGRPVPATLAAGSRSAAAAAGRIGDRLAERRRAAASSTRSSARRRSTSSDTGVGPTPSPKTSAIAVGADDAGARQREGRCRSSDARPSAAPRPGVKIRTRTSVSGRSGGSTNVVSEKFISLAIACIVVGRQPAAVEKHRELIAAEEPIGEDVEMK